MKFHDKFWERDGHPKRCWRCISPQLKYETVDTIEHHVCEYRYVCGKCGARLAWWGYGSYDPDYLMTPEVELRHHRKEFKVWKSRGKRYPQEVRWENRRKKNANVLDVLWDSCGDSGDIFGRGDDEQ